MPDYPQEAQPQNLPFQVEAEQAFLGCLLLDPSTISVALEEISGPDMLYLPQHQKLYRIFLNMFDLAQTVDFVTVLQEVENAGIFREEGEAKTYLVQLMDAVPSTANLRDYCRIIRDYYYRRRLILAAGVISHAAQQGDSSSERLLELAEQSIYDIRQGKNSGAMVPIETAVIETFDRLQHLTGEDRAEYAGLPTGFVELDAKMTGLNKSDLILVAARPGMGKTAFALNVAAYVATHSKREVAIFSLEMSREQLTSRMLASESQVPGEALKTGRLDQNQWVQLSAAADRLSQTHIYIDDTAGIQVGEIKAKCRKLRNLGFIVIDYLQLIESGSRTDNRVQEVSKITRHLKVMAKELNVPVMVLSQLNRAADSRADHRPMLSDLRESGSIEQDADIVLLLMREGYYNPETEHPNEASCLLEKNRHGGTGEIKLGWNGSLTRFTNLEQRREGY